MLPTKAKKTFGKKECHPRQLGASADLPILVPCNRHHLHIIFINSKDAKLQLVDELY